MRMIHLARRAALPSIARPATIRSTMAQRGLSRTAIAFNARSEPPKDEKKDQKPQKAESLLTDDILAQAGMDVDGMNKQSAKEEGFEGDSSGHEQQKKWAGTAKKHSDRTSTAAKREQRSGWGVIAMIGFTAGALAYSARDWDTEEEAEKHADAPNGYSPVNMYHRVNARVSDLFSTINDPLFEKLLPDPLPEPYNRPLTLVVGMEDVLIHSEWTREHGWRTAKRPGMDYFLGYLAQYYEIVVFTNGTMVNTERAAMALDPYKAAVSHTLFREHSRYKDGKFIKDLSHLNRDPSKVIMIDCNPDAYSLQPENAVPLAPWQGTPGDKELVRLIPFLEWIAASNVKDVRPIVKSFEGTNVTEEYARREAVARKSFEEDWQRQYNSSGGMWAARVLGLAPKIPPTPKMPQDLMREAGQKGYEEYRKFIAEHGEKMLAEEKQREKEFMNEQKLTLNKIVTEGMPTAEDALAFQKKIEQEQREREAAMQVAQAHPTSK